MSNPHQAYQAPSLQDVSPGNISTRLIGLLESYNAGNTGVIVYLNNAAYVHFENASGHFYRCTFTDRFQNSYDIYLRPMSSKDISLGAKILLQANIIDLTVFGASMGGTAQTPFVALGSDVGGLQADAQYLQQIKAGGSWITTQMQMGYLLVTSAQYPIEIRDNPLAQVTQDNCVLSGPYSTAAAQALDIGVNVLGQSADDTTSQSGPFHTLTVINNSALPTAALKIYENPQQLTDTAPNVATIFPPGIITQDIVFYACIGNSTAAGQQLMASYRHGAQYLAGNAGIW